MKHQWDLRRSAWMWERGEQGRDLGQLYGAYEECQRGSSKTWAFSNSNRVTKHSKESVPTPPLWCVTSGAQRQWDTQRPALQDLPTYWENEQLKMCQRTHKGFSWENSKESRRASQVQGGRESAGAGRRHLGGDGIWVGLQGQVQWDRLREGRRSWQRNTLHPPTHPPHCASNFRAGYQPPAVPWTFWEPADLRGRSPALVLRNHSVCAARAD